MLEWVKTNVWMIAITNSYSQTICRLASIEMDRQGAIRCILSENRDQEGNSDPTEAAAKARGSGGNFNRKGGRF
jgi:hypothetical protein